MYGIALKLAVYNFPVIVYVVYYLTFLLRYFNVNFNLVLRGGGLQGQAPPFLEYEIIPSRLIGDIAPEGGDGVVDFQDLGALADAWLSTTSSPNWNPQADIAPRPVSDGSVNFFDLAVLAGDWLKTIEP